MTRQYDASGIRFSALIPYLDLAALQAGNARDTDVLGLWRHDAAGLCYEVRLLPAAMAWTSDFTTEEMLAWIGHHIARHVRHVFQEK
jgi:hypothetical protein